MKALIKLVVCGSLLFSTLPLTSQPAVAKTVEDTPPSSETLGSMADDPLADKQVTPTAPPTTLEPDGASASPPDSSKTESATKEPEPNESNLTESDTPQVNTKQGVGPQAMNLIEGRPGDSTPYDIDADFANVLRAVQGWSLKPVNGITDEDMASLTNLSISNWDLVSLKGIEYAINLKTLNCYGNQLTELDLSKNVLLTNIYCNNNQLTELDVTNCILLEELIAYRNKISNIDINKLSLLTRFQISENELTNLDVSGNVALSYLDCQLNQITSLDVSHKKFLDQVVCNDNNLTSLNVSGATSLRALHSYNNELTNIDLSTNISLTKTFLYNNQLTEIKTVGAVNLESLYVGNNKLQELDITTNLSLVMLACQDNKLKNLHVSNNKELIQLYCLNNQLEELNINTNTNLKILDCSQNQIPSLNLVNNTLLTSLTCDDNKISTLDVSKNTALETLTCSNNRIYDISSAFQLTHLTTLAASNQNIVVSIPAVTNNEASIEILKTTAHLGLSATNGDVSPSPTFNYNGDNILLSNVTRESLENKFINFSYDGSQLSEGATAGTKTFDGTISFFELSDLTSSLKPSKYKEQSGKEIEWTWTISNKRTKKAEDILAAVTLPSGWVLDPTSIEKNGVPTNINEINGTTSIGSLDPGEDVVFTFKTTISGNVDEWLELTGRVDWTDDTSMGPYFSEEKRAIKILDDEQTDTPKEAKDLGLLSTPFYLNYGIQEIAVTPKTYTLHPNHFQTNTNVVSKGFYTRVKDDRSASTGWKLTAKLSDFVDASNQVMPNSSGAQLTLDDLSIEAITDRDTPQEAIDPSPSGTPSSVQTSETLIAGQAAKTLVSAQPGEGQGTWQLRMPFDKLALSLPAYAGKTGTHYKATLTWSLDDTP